MVTVRAFNWLRPKKETVKKVACPPYDVVTTESAGKMAGDNENSFLHVIRPEIDLEEGIDPYGDEAYNKAAVNLQRLIRENIMIRDEEPCIYAYTQSTGGHSQTGIVACCAVNDYEDNKIKKHEFTREDKEKDRARHISAVSAHTGLVFLMYRDTDTMNYLTEEACRISPLYHFTDENEVNHIVYKIDMKSCGRNMLEAFNKISRLYIADGHHRAAAASRVRNERQDQNSDHTGEEDYNFFPAVLFPQSALKILPYNRVVADLAGLSREDFLNKVKKNFRITPTDAPRPSMKGHFCMYLDGQWHLLVDKPWERKGYDPDDPVKNLDCQILQDSILEPILNISDPRTDARIDFVGGVYGPAELRRRVDEGEAEVAFLLHPVSTEDIMKVSDAGRTMPPKSTWFEPKLRSGLFVHPF